MLDTVPDVSSGREKDGQEDLGGTREDRDHCQGSFLPLLLQEQILIRLVSGSFELLGMETVCSDRLYRVTMRLISLEMMFGMLLLVLRKKQQRLWL